MILKIKTAFDVDVELVDQLTNSVSIERNHVVPQEIELPENEMNNLLSCLQFSSSTFKINKLTKFDNTLIWE